MIITARDYDGLRLLAKYTLLTRTQYRWLGFSGNLSPEPARRSLLRLKQAQLITEFDIKTKTGEWWYKPSKRGYKMFPPTERYRRGLSQPMHTYEIANTAVELVKLGCPESSITTEPELLASGMERADLELRFGQHMQLEVDRDTEGAKYLRLKLAAYVRGFQEAWIAGATGYPLIVWIVPSAARVKLLQRLVDETETPELFRVYTLEQYLKAVDNSFIS